MWHETQNIFVYHLNMYGNIYTMNKVYNNSEIIKSIFMWNILWSTMVEMYISIYRFANGMTYDEKVWNYSVENCINVPG